MSILSTLEHRVRQDHPLRAVRSLTDAALSSLSADFAALYWRKFFDVWESWKSPVAKEAIDRIAAFYVIEEGADRQQHR